MQNIKINTAAAITNVNLRKEIHGDNLETAVDVSIKITGAANDVLSLLCEPDALIGSLWSGEDGYLADPGVSSFKLNREYTDHKFSVLKIELEGVKVCKFNVLASDGRHVELKFQVQCYPTKKQIGELSELIGENADITIEPQQASLLDKGEDK